MTDPFVIKIIENVPGTTYGEAESRLKENKRDLVKTVKELARQRRIDFELAPNPFTSSLQVLDNIDWEDLRCAQEDEQKDKK